MAARKTISNRAVEYTCKDCAYSDDWHNVGADGQMIFCRCKYHQWSRFLNHDYCERFTKRH